MRPLTGVTAALGVLLLSLPGGGTAASSDTIWTVAGTGVSGNSPDGTQATEAAIDRPRSIFSTRDGGYVWAQPWSNRVLKVGPGGVLTRIAGTGEAGFSGDGGPATAARINFVHSASPTADGGYLLADTGNQRIRYVSARGVITTVAGNGVQGYSGDGGPATAASLNAPRGVTALADGSFLIPDSSNNRVRKVSRSGVITTVAGTGVPGFGGDGGPATAAMLSLPFGVAPTADGGFLIADTGNLRIRKVSAAGVITTVAGTGGVGSTGDGGPATAAQIYNPHNVVAQPDGGFLVAEPTAHRVRRVGPDGTIFPFAGNGAGSGTGTGAFGGDGGAAASAQLNDPKAVAVTREGAVLIADEQNNRIRFVGSIVTPANVARPTVRGIAEVGRTMAGDPGAWSGTGPRIAYQWRRCKSNGNACTNILGATRKMYVATSADRGSTLRLQVTATNAAGRSAQVSGATAPVARLSNRSRVSVYSKRIVADSPRSYWRLGETTGPLVDQRGFKNGRYVNKPKRGVPGLITGDTGTAVLLNGVNQHLTIPADPVWTSQTFSIEIVVKPSVLPANKTIWSTQEAVRGWWLNTDVRGVARIFVGTGASWRYTPVGRVLAAGKRYHLVVTYDGTRARLYVNGSLASTGPIAKMAPNTTSAPMRLGEYAGAGQNWPGVLDDASFYAVALTRSQVAAHYNASVSRRTASATTLVRVAQR